ncbi:calcium-binding and spermatid-specific protein 1 [Notamacropus eugenii]|uniref:calcium-binding and spermatid-specific protein 1 n=1 Tax=Notamacropus eugenii TaxID=9315 RepID=UPI003B66BA81
MASNRDFLLASTETEAFPSKDMDSFDNKIAHGEDPSEVSGAEIEKIQEAVATPMTFFITPKANISYVGTYTEPLMDVTATSAFVPTKRSTPAISRATTFYVRYFKPQNHTTVSEANSTLVSTGDTTLLTTETLNFSPGATAGISPETFHLKERSLDDADVIVSEASGPVSEKPLPINGALIPEWNVLSVQSDPQALQLESTLPHVDSTVLLRNPAYTNPDTVGTVKEDPLTETASSSEKYPSPKRTTSAAAPFNLREDTGFRTGATPYEADAPIEEIASDEQEAALHRVEEVAEEDDIPQERENTPSSTYFSPFMSGNDTLEGKNSDPEDGSVFHEANNNHVIIDAINPPLQITTNGETKASNSISPRDEKPSTVVNSTTQRADDNIKTITADPIPDGMIKATTEFKGITNTEQNYSEPEDIAYLPDVADLSIKRKAQRDGDVGPDADSPLASKDTRPPKAGSTGPVPFATLLEDKDNSTFVPRDYATNNVAGTKFPKQETKTAVAEMADSQKDISSMTSFTAPADVRMPYTNTGNEYRKDLAANAAIPLTWKALVMVAKNVMLPSEYIQHNSESAASEVGTATSTGGTPLTALTKPICEHLPPSNKSQINYHGRDVTPIIFEALEAGPDNSLPNDAATLGQPLTKMETDLPTLSLVAALLPDDSSRYTIKAIYTRHAAVTARKKEARTVSVPDILNTPNNVPGADIGDRINPSGYQLDIIIEESASMEFDEIPFVEEDISAEGDVIYLEEENNSDDDLMTFVLDNNVSAYVTEDYTIAPLSPIINTPTLTHEPSQLGTYASYNKADSSYSSSEIATADPTETKSKETSHTVILEYEPTDSEIHTTMLKSVAPRTIAYSSSDGSKKISSRFLKMTTKEQNNKVVDDATTFLPQTSNPKKKRTDSSFALDPDTGFLTEESETFTKGTFGSAGEPASIENKETLDMNIAADVFTSGRNTSVTLLEEQYSKNNLKTVGSEISTSQDSTSPSELLMSHGTDRISHMDENMETVTDMVTTANMPATEKVASVGVLPVQDGDSPISKADVTMLLDNNPLLTHAKPSLPPDAKTDNAAASLQGKNEALLDDYFLVLEETETVVEPTEHDTNVPEITLLSKDANPLASEDNVIHIEESLSYDTDLVGGAHSNSEDNYITLESDAFYLNVIMNSHLTNANGPETIAFRDPITAGEKNSEDELYAKNLPTDKAKVPMETITMIDVITDGIKTTPQEVTPGKESNRAAVQVAAFEPDMPHSETRVGTHKDSHIVSDWDPAFTRTDPSSFRTESTNLAENTTSPESQETVIPKDTIDPRAECMITATDATSEEKEENSMAEITSLENDVTPMSFISHKTEDIEPTTNSGIADVITAEEETPTSLFSASILYNGYIKPEDGPIVSGANSAPVSTDDTTLLNDATVDNTQETLPLKEMSLDDADMTVSEASGPILEKSLPVNGALIPERNVLSVQSDPQALQLESTLPPADSTLLPRTPPYTDTDTVGTVKEDPATETATSGEKYPSPKRAISAAAIINLREHTDFMIETARYEADIFVEEIISGKHGVAFQREEEDIIAEEHGVTQEKENTLYSTDFSTYISSSNILMGNELDPQDYSTFPKREDINSISEVNKITTDLSKCAAQPASSQNSIPTVTSFSVPGADRISFDNQDSKTPLSYSDLTGDMSFMAQANPIVAKVPTPTSLPNRSEDDILISRSGTDKSSEDTTLSMDIISILEDEFTSEKVQDTLQVKDGSLADLKKAKSAYLLNLVTDHSAPMNNLGIQEGSITKTPTHLHAFPLDASRENTISSVDSTNTKYDPSTTREEDTTSEMSFDAITTSPGSSFLEEKFPVSSAAEVVAEDPPPTPTTHITRNVTGETISSVTDDAAPEEQTAITSEAHLTSVNDSIPESDVITTAVNFMNTFSDFISSVTDKLPLLKETPTSEFNTKLRHVETPTSDGAEGVSSITNTARLSPGVMSLTEEEVISYETGIISSTSNDAFLVSDDDDATVPANEVSDFMMQDLEGEKITVLDRTAPSKEDGPNATAKVNGFVQKDDIIEEKDMFSVADLTNSEKEDTTMSETSNSTEEDTADDHWLWMEGNPEDELNATVLILNASKNKDSSASEAKNTHEDKNTMKAFLTKLVGGPTESVTNVTDSFPTSPTAGHPTDSREDSTTATDVTNLKQEDSKDTL